MFTLCEWLEILAALRFSAELVDVIRAERIVRCHRDAYGSVNTRQLFDDRGVLDITHARAAILFGKDHSEQTKLCEFRF